MKLTSNKYKAIKNYVTFMPFLQGHPVLHNGTCRWKISISSIGKGRCKENCIT